MCVYVYVCVFVHVFVYVSVYSCVCICMDGWMVFFACMCLFHPSTPTYNVRHVLNNEISVVRGFVEFGACDAGVRRRVRVLQTGNDERIVDGILVDAT